MVYSLKLLSRIDKNNNNAPTGGQIKNTKCKKEMRGLTEFPVLATTFPSGRVRCFLQADVWRWKPEE
jgi:hypothetical protein